MQVGQKPKQKPVQKPKPTINKKPDRPPARGDIREIYAKVQEDLERRRITQEQADEEIQWIIDTWQPAGRVAQEENTNTANSAVATNLRHNGGGNKRRIEASEMSDSLQTNNVSLEDSIEELKGILYEQYPAFAPPIGPLGQTGLERGLSGVGAALAGARFDRAIEIIQSYASLITEAGEKYNIPPEIIAAIILKEQYTQSLPDFLVVGLGVLFGREGSTGLGAITPDTARKAWQYVNPDIASIFENDIVLMAYIANDDEFAIETIAAVLQYKAYGLGYHKPISELSDNELKNLLSYYNGGNLEFTDDMIKYGNFTSQYIPYMTPLLS